MKEKNISRLIYSIMITGLIMLASGIALATFTNLVSEGHIMLLALMIAIGLLLAAPSKLYLTFQMMHKNDEKLREQNKSTKPME
ncbi:MAG: hypothetical protein KAH22_08825 [Thiotrichaceae bacterium]|nr:hypothetical protein [Thiotrichaceae bacterium]